ncbi:MAG: DNA-directed RNA polymerase subunit E [Candidatus Altiarchaeales archaeon]|nr:MAG: DNA-directed RNA polymerase subunit E [Candidatus Altiarchaeales archaeon]RLI94732.1 MAG: DNA-directed RNA polymerase subunit E [Candidatus Altiarchaeales archaeon]RLI94836.1 MAG: DNA-directed RNA polymerase subunit E [Candidatus Altiarchaeales archaeon]HDO82696.1 DNA-directed RNA polymerase, subunit E'' [Candidatus Altiarchaeales archaeon]HEX55345.1 DNA-directed RNA polymerase, subunit E'' [Candidatus Altiarchaeales archaeon]
MKTNKLRACKKCHILTEKEICPICSLPTSQYWSGYLAVIDPEKSEIAKKMNAKLSGEYAIKVR